MREVFLSFSSDRSSPPHPPVFSHHRTKVPPDDAVPQRRVPPVKLLLNVRGDVLLDRVLVDGLFFFFGRGRRSGLSERGRRVFFKATALLVEKKGDWIGRVFCP